MKLLVGGLLIWFLYSRISDTILSRDLFKLPFSEQAAYWFLLAFSFSFINWFLEAKKWQVLVSPFQKMKTYLAYQSVLAGLATGLVTPNRLGNFIGRLAYVQEGHKTQATIHTQVGNLAQFIISIIIGIGGLFISLIYLNQNLNLYMFVLTPGLLLIVAIWLYFNPKSILKLPFGNKIMAWRSKEINDLAAINNSLKWRVLAFSTGRYSIFIIQYYCLFKVFEISQSPLIISALSATTFLITTVIPGIFFGKLLVRESAAVFVFSWIALPISVILSVSFLLWLINLAIPAAFGWYFWIKKPKV
ncbi:MAG: lysylphosphatidylglycerol synthase domain-containing protein [Crocinitomicaceae bacterium]